MRTLVVAAAALLLGNAVAAQAPAYNRTPGSLLKYREIRTDENETIQNYGGDSFIKTERDAVWNIRFLPGDTAVVWYDRLTEALIPETGLPRTRHLTHRVGKREILRFAATGQIALMAGLKEDPQALYSDLEDDWSSRFIVLPKEPIAVGSQWTYRASVEDESAGDPMHGSQETNYRVTGERMVDGKRALVIEERSRGIAKLDSPYAPAHVEAEANTTATAVFLVEAGILYERTMTGTVKVTARANDGSIINVNTTSRFTSHQQLVR